MVSGTMVKCFYCGGLWPLEEAHPGAKHDCKPENLAARAGNDITDIRKYADLKFQIPRPPSMNMAYVNTKFGRKKSDHFEHWLTACDIHLGFTPYYHPPKGKGIMHGNYKVVIEIERVKENTGDVANYEKGIIDYFVSRRIVPDDRFIDSVTMKYFADRRKGDFAYVYFKAVE